MSGFRKLTPANVEWIRFRRSLAGGRWPLKLLASRLNVSMTCVSLVALGKRHITPTS